MSKFSELLKNVFDITTEGYAADARALKTLNDRIDGLQVAGTPVVDNLTNESATSALSAKQGKILKGLIDNVDTNLNGTSYLMVYGTGTPTDNAAELRAAYEEAKRMPRYLGVGITTHNTNFYKGQTFKHPYAGTYHRFIVDALNTVSISDSSKFESVSKEEAESTRTTVIVAPGEYGALGNPFILTASGINIVSLTGNADVFIGDHITMNGLRIAVDHIHVKGVNCRISRLDVDNDLDNVVVENCVAGYGSYGYNGTTSTFINCVGDGASFGYYAAFNGTAINCIGGMESFNGGIGALGKLVNVSLTEYVFGYPTVGAIIINCIDGGGNVINYPAIQGVDIVNNLSTVDSAKALSASMGKFLNDTKLSLVKLDSSELSNLTYNPIYQTGYSYFSTDENKVYQAINMGEDGGGWVELATIDNRIYIIEDGSYPGLFISNGAGGLTKIA